MYVCIYVYTHHTRTEFNIVRRGRQRFMLDISHIYTIPGTHRTIGPLPQHHRACLTPYPPHPLAPLLLASCKTQVATKVPTLNVKR
jgi:hypothetical protein